MSLALNPRVDRGRRGPRVGLRRDDHAARRGHGSVRSAGRSSSPARPRCVKMRRTTRGSSIVAIRRIRPPQFGHASTSTAKTLWSNSAQRQRRGGAALPGGSADCGEAGSRPGAVAADTSAAAPGPTAMLCSALPGMAVDVVAGSAAGPAIGAGSSAVAGCLRAPVRDRRGPPLGAGRQDPVVEDDVDARAGRQRVPRNNRYRNRTRASSLR